MKKEYMIPTYLFVTLNNQDVCTASPDRLEEGIEFENDKQWWLE